MWVAFDNPRLPPTRGHMANTLKYSSYNGNWLTDIILDLTDRKKFHTNTTNTNLADHFVSSTIPSPCTKALQQLVPLRVHVHVSVWNVLISFSKIV